MDTSKHLASSSYHKATTGGQMTKLTKNQFNTSKKKKVLLYKTDSEISGQRAADMMVSAGSKQIK